VRWGIRDAQQKIPKHMLADGRLGTRAYDFLIAPGVHNLDLQGATETAKLFLPNLIAYLQTLGRCLHLLG